jgi:osmotically-inducible protein OsmY
VNSFSIPQACLLRYAGAIGFHTNRDRAAIVKDKSLSTTAHNIKLVAAGGVVTLRGPVNSEAEKVKIEALAVSVSGVHSVDNQLDIKTHIKH